MKKLLTAALAIAMGATFVGALAACNKGGNNDADTVKKAINTVRTLYYDAAKVTRTDYEVIGQTKPNNVVVTINWTATPAETCTIENFSNYVSVGAMNDENMVPISINQATVAIDYTLTASVKVGKATDSISFERQVPAGEDIGIGDREVLKAKLDFTEDTYRTSGSTDQQVWEQNGIKFTNLKGSSNINLTYINPLRLYKGSTIKIEFPGMKQLIFTSEKNYNDNPYITRLQTSLEAVVSDAKFTLDEEANTLTVVLENPLDTLEFVASEQIRFFSIDITGYKGGATDEEKVAGAKSMLDLPEKTFSMPGLNELPSAKNSATITWAVKEASEYASIKEGKLSIDKLPTDTATVALVATIKSGSATDTKEITITVNNIGLEHAGTAADPYTPSEALKVAKLLAVGATATTEVYVKGYVIEPGTYSTQYKNFDNMYIADTYAANKDKTAEDALYVFRPSPDGTYLTTDGFNKGDLVTFKGKLQNYTADVQELTSATCVARKVVERTDDETVTAAKEALTLSKTIFKTTDDFALPTSVSGISGASVEWAVKGTSEIVEVTSNTLKIKSLPSEEAKVTLVATITCGNATAQTKEIEITVVAPAASATFEEGVYKLAIQQNGLSTPKKLYFTGAMDATQTYYGGLTESVAAAADVEVKAVTGGYTFKVVSTGKYIELIVDGTHVNFALVETASTTIAWVYDAELETFTWTNEKGTYYLGTRSTYTTVSASEIKYITGDNAANVGVSQFVAKFETVTPPAGMTDEEKVDAAIEALNAASWNSYADKTGEITLPTVNVEGVTITWSSDKTEYVTIVDNAKANVLKLAETEAVAVTITASVNCGGADGVTKSATLSLTIDVADTTNYGTLEAPLTVTEALAIAATQCAVKNAYTKQVIFMTGVATGAPELKTNATTGDTYYQNLTLADPANSEKTILVYPINLRDEVALPAQNDVIVVSGYITNYNNLIEFSNNKTASVNVYIESNTRGNSTITLGDHEGATVTDIPETAVLNGTEVTITVTALEGKEIVAVNVGGNKIDEDAETAGNYKFTVAGNMTVMVETKDAGSTGPSTASVTVAQLAADGSWAGSGSPQVSDITVDENISVEIKGGNNTGKYYATEIRIYQTENPTIEVKAKTGYKIVSVKITYSVSNTGVLTNSDKTVNYDSNEIIAVNAASVTFTVGNTGTKTNGQVKITAIEVKYEADSTSSGTEEGGETQD